MELGLGVTILVGKSVSPYVSGTWIEGSFRFESEGISCRLRRV